MTFANVLFSPLRDFENPAAIRRVMDVAEDASALTILGTSPAPTRRTRLIHRHDWIEDVVASRQKEIAQHLETWAALGGADRATKVVRSGDPAATIVEQVIASSHDLVVVTTDDDREDHITIKRLLRECPCPVWVLRRSRARIARVMAAVSTEPDEEDLNQAVLDLAAKLHRVCGGELHVVHAWELFGEATLRNSSMTHTSEAEIDRLIRAEHADAKDAVEALLQAAGPELKWRTHLRNGPVDKVIPEVVTTKRINHLVVGTMARHGLNGLIIGNTAEQVIDHVTCSVLVTKPPVRDPTPSKR